MNERRAVLIAQIRNAFADVSRLGGVSLEATLHALQSATVRSSLHLLALHGGRPGGYGGFRCRLRSVEEALGTVLPIGNSAIMALNLKLRPAALSRNQE